MLAKELTDDFLIGARRHGDRVSDSSRPEPCDRPMRRTANQGHHTEQTLFRVQDIAGFDCRDRLTRLPANIADRLIHGKIGTESAETRVHQTACSVFRIGQQGGDFPLPTSSSKPRSAARASSGAACTTSAASSRASSRIRACRSEGEERRSTATCSDTGSSRNSLVIDRRCTRQGLVGHGAFQVLKLPGRVIMSD